MNFRRVVIHRRALNMQNQNIEIFRNRRKEFVHRMSESSVAIFFSAPVSYKNSDVDYSYRQDSDFYYLTGFAEEDSILVVDEKRSILFLRPNDPEKEIWNGYRLGIEKAPGALGVDEAYDSTTFHEKLPDLLKGKENLYYAFGQNPERDARILSAANALIRGSRAGEHGPTKIHHPSSVLHLMRMFKTPEEMDQLRECANITAEAHLAAMRRTRPEMMEYEIEALFHYHFRRNGAREAYGTIVAGGPRACVLHYVSNDRPLKDGQLVLIDAGSEKNNMSSDVTRTFPAGLKFSDSQRMAYEVVLMAQKKAFAQCKVGETMESVHRSALNVIIDGIKELGLLSQSRDEILDQGLYKRFYMHKTGHWLGADVHDVGPYFDQSGKPVPLQNNMVFTVEPGIYIPDEPDIPEEFRGIGIRIEDDVIIRDNDPEIVTSAVPTDPDRIEYLRQENGI